MSFIIEDMSSPCPTQGHGTIAGNPWYFRARHGEWRLTVADPGDDPIAPTHAPVFHIEGDDPWNGFMPEAVGCLLVAYLLARLHLGEKDNDLVADLLDWLHERHADAVDG